MNPHNINIDSDTWIFFFGEQREKKHSFWKHIHFHIWRKILSVLFQLYLAVNHREKFSKNLYVYILFVIWPPYVDYILSGRSVFTSGKEFFFYFLVKIQKKKIFTLTVRPSSWWFCTFSTFLTEFGSINVTKPKPRDLPVSGFFIIKHSVTSPNSVK